jgi:hypothetical protein
LLADYHEDHERLGGAWPGPVPASRGNLGQGDVVPADLRHKLWLQDCFNDLSGLGQDDDMTLEDEEEPYRIDEFIERLRDCKESVEDLGLTLDTLLSRVIFPDGDRPIFVRLLSERLGLTSASDQLADHL